MKPFLPYHFSKAMLALALLIPSVATAHDVEVKNADGKTIYYKKLSDTEVSVTYGCDDYGAWFEYTGAVNIPPTVTFGGNIYSLTSIGNNAFSYCSGLTTVNLNAANCTSMGSSSSSVFKGCSNLKSLNIGNKVHKGAVTLISTKGTCVSIHYINRKINGMEIAKIQLESGIASTVSFPMGIYIINHKKINI